MEPITSVKTKEEFEALLQGEKPLLVDFYADWCGPCRMLSPLVKEIAEERRETLSVAKLNVDELPEVANRHGIVAIPALLLFKNGEMEEKLVGYREKEDLDDFLDEHL